jgi:uncharacterized protein (TIGR03000 family)
MRSVRLLALAGVSVGLLWAGQATAQQPGNQPVHMKFRVPAEAQLWLDGTATTMQGQVREMISPPLPPGKSYVYTVRVRWQRYGQVIDQKREITVKAGDFIDMDFEGSAGGYTMNPIIRYGERAYAEPSRQQPIYFSMSDVGRGNSIGWAARQTGILSYYGATPGWGSVDSTGVGSGG